MKVSGSGDYVRRRVLGQLLKTPCTAEGEQSQGRLVCRMGRTDIRLRLGALDGEAPRCIVSRGQESNTWFDQHIVSAGSTLLLQMMIP